MYIIYIVYTGATAMDVRHQSTFPAKPCSKFTSDGEFFIFLHQVMVKEGKPSQGKYILDIFWLWNFLNPPKMLVNDKCFFYASYNILVAQLAI